MREHKILSWVLGLWFTLLWLGGLAACDGTEASPTAAAVPTATLAQHTAEAEWRAIAYQACNVISPGDSPTHCAGDIASSYASDVPLNRDSYYRPSWCTATEEGPDWKTLSCACIDAVRCRVDPIAVGEAEGGETMKRLSIPFHRCGIKGDTKWHFSLVIRCSTENTAFRGC